MKKLVLFAVAAIALSFAACDNKAKNAEEEAKRSQDSVDAVMKAAQEEADKATSALSTDTVKIDSVKAN